MPYVGRARGAQNLALSPLLSALPFKGALNVVKRIQGSANMNQIKWKYVNVLGGGDYGSRHLYGLPVCKSNEDAIVSLSAACNDWV